MEEKSEKKVSIRRSALPSPEENLLSLTFAFSTDSPRLKGFCGAASSFSCSSWWTSTHFISYTCPVSQNPVIRLVLILWPFLCTATENKVCKQPFTNFKTEIHRESICNHVCQCPLCLWPTYKTKDSERHHHFCDSCSVELWKVYFGNMVWGLSLWREKYWTDLEMEN